MFPDRVDPEHERKDMASMKRTFALAFFTVMLMIPSAAVQARDELDIDPDRGRLFNERDMAPGESVSAEVSARNRTKDKADLFLSVDGLQGERLARVMQVAVIDRTNGEYLVGGENDGMTLADLNGAHQVFLERLGKNRSGSYEIRLTFDPNAGNRYQGTKTKFDLSFRLTSSVAKPDSNPPCRTDRCRDRWEHERGRDDDRSNDRDWRGRFVERYHRFSDSMSWFFGRVSQALSRR